MTLDTLQLDHPLTLALLALAGLNLFAFLAMGYDKRQAVYSQRRVPEATFFTLALCGGSLGVFFAMQTFRHKRRKPSFYWRIYLIIFLQIIALLALPSADLAMFK